ncbi:apolipoprotein L6 [Chelydra serpentina]|uniref:Apolipoprotein L6 n=1 Tax=Chelydra serpentina TaxID=8475 RepID=A0A8T1RWZ1_CHESE|nr:apolipoprotein L6 [Chelydra serpentina]
MEILRDALRKKNRVLMEMPQDLFFGDSKDPRFWMERHAILTEELLRGLISELEAVKFKEDLTWGNSYTYVYPESGDKTVYLCPLFWKASTYLGKGSQPGSLIHEACHFLGIRDINHSKESIDVAFAWREKLAKVKVGSEPSVLDLNPLEKAVLNANNIKYEFEVTLNHKEEYKNGRYSCCGEKAVNSVCERAVREEFLSCNFQESLSIIKDIDYLLMESLLPARTRVKRHLKELREIADAIDKIHKGATIASITGGTVGIAGGITTIVGLALIPVTFGASLIVSLTGLAVSTAGGLTSAAATTTDIVASKVKRETVENVLMECQIEVDQMKGYAERIEERIQRLRENENSRFVFAIPQIGAGAGRSILNTIKMVKAGQLLANIGRIARFAGAATHVLTALTLGLDIFFVAKDSVDLHKGAKTELAAKIREIVHDIEQMIGEDNETCTTLTADKQK